MFQANFGQLVTHLHNDQAFRERFAAAPAQALQENGYDPGLFVLPDKIDLAAFERRLDNVFGGNEENLSAGELWNRFSTIDGVREFKASSADVPIDDPGVVVGTDPIVVVVVYGVSMAVGSQDGVPAESLQAITQLGTLRKLARISKEKLRFSVSGPDGTSATDMPVDMIKAFVSRLEQAND